MFPSVLIGTLHGETIPHASGGAGQTKDEVARAAAAENGAQELPPGQGKLGEAVWLDRKPDDSLVSLLALPLPYCVTLSMLLEHNALNLFSYL